MSRNFSRYTDGIGCGAILAYITFLFLLFAGWLTHVIYCFQHHQWIILLIGAIAAPLGSIHGWGLWFHWWH